VVCRALGFIGDAVAVAEGATAFGPTTTASKLVIQGCVGNETTPMGCWCAWPGQTSYWHEICSTSGMEPWNATEGYLGVTCSRSKGKRLEWAGQGRAGQGGVE